MDTHQRSAAVVLIHLVVVALVSVEGAPQEGEVRLVHGQEFQGNVQIYHNGKWGAVCDDGWVLSAAKVVCRMLGFKRALGHTKQGYFGKVASNIEFVLDDVRCSGNEDSLSDCDHRKWNDHNCDIREAAGVYCDKDSKLQELVAPEISIIVPHSTTRDRTTHRPVTTTTVRTNGPTTTRTSTTTWHQSSGRTSQRPTQRQTRPRTRSHRRPTVRPNRRRQNPIENEIQNDGSIFGDGFSTNAVFIPRRTTTFRPSTTVKSNRRTAQKTPKGRNNRNNTPQKSKAKTVRRLGIRRPKNTTKPKKPAVTTTKPNKPTVTKPTKKPHHHKNKNYGPDNVPKYQLRVTGGRTKAEGRVEIRIDDEKWGVICSDNWGLREATVVCRHAGLNHAQSATQANYFGGESLNKVLGGVKCKGDEKTLHQCYHSEVLASVTCKNKNNIAGVMCTDFLPDLVPNATLLTQAYLEDRPLPYMECAMEEGCASSSAYRIRENSRDWTRHARRLMRFSSSTWNLGTADFRPYIAKHEWEWHSCHMHYHSMEVFAHYDILDQNHNRVAEGHKASFCLEDVQCLPGHTRRYKCQGFGEQGISVGCADDYLHDIDCQWIDITDLNTGKYYFKVQINPDYMVAELDYDNNVATCDLYYTGNRVIVSNCKLGNLPSSSGST